MIENFYDLKVFMEDVDFRMPGWEVKVEPADNYWIRQERYAHIFVEATTTDTYHPENPEPLKVLHMQTIAYPVEEGYMIRFIRRAIHIAVTHEADEWLRYKGDMVFNPHKGA